MFVSSSDRSGFSVGRQPERSLAVSRQAAPPPSPSLADGIRALWAVRWHGIIGGIVMSLAAIAFWSLAEPRYESSAQVYIDPKDLQLLSRELTPNLMPGDSGTVIIESQARIMQSASVLRAVVNDLRLDRDTEFNGEGTELSLETIKRAVKDFIAGGEADVQRKDPVQTAVDQLARQINVVRADRTYVIGVYARSRDPEKAAAIANGMVDAYLELREGQRSSQADTATRSLEARLEELFAKLETSEDAVERFKVESGLVGAGGSLLVEDRLAQANRDVSAAQVAVDRVATQREQLSRMRNDPDLFLSSTEALGSADIARLRGDLEQIDAQIGTLDATLGPRHPRRVEAEGRRATTRRALEAEIARLYSNAVLAEDRANAQLAAAASALDRLTGDVQASDAFRVRLRQLERDAETGRSVYEEALLRSRETREQQSVSTINVQLVSPATPALRKTFPPSLTILLPLAFAIGAGIGMALGLLSRVLKAPNAVPARPVAGRPFFVAGRPASRSQAPSARIVFKERSGAPARVAPLLMAPASDRSGNGGPGDDEAKPRANERHANAGHAKTGRADKPDVIPMPAPQTAANDAEANDETGHGAGSGTHQSVPAFSHAAAGTARRTESPYVTHLAHQAVRHPAKARAWHREPARLRPAGDGHAALPKGATAPSKVRGKHAGKRFAAKFGLSAGATNTVGATPPLGEQPDGSATTRPGASATVNRRRRKPRLRIKAAVIAAMAKTPPPSPSRQ